MNWLICLAGEIASGKTTLADALHAALPGSARLAFGDVVRRHTLAAGQEPTRRNLQDTGLRLIAGGWPAFVGDLLGGLDGDPAVLIVEGVRHREAADALAARLRPARHLLVYVEIDDARRGERLAGRSETNTELDHAVERDVTTLRETADLVVSTADPVDVLVTRVTGLLR